MGSWLLIFLILNPIASLVSCVALMGGHKDNKNVSDSLQDRSNYVDKARILNKNPNTVFTSTYNNDNEDNLEPDDVKLNYNTQHVFNNGLPFYVEKDPVTGIIDFNSKISIEKTDIDDSEQTESQEVVSVHKQDKNGDHYYHNANTIQSTSPNLLDYLNIPTSYNSSKYVYPLISSSYANTKIQGNNKNKIYNHKESKVTTSKPPYYYNQKYSAELYNPNKEQFTLTTAKPVVKKVVTTRRTTTTSPSSTTTTTTSTTSAPTTSTTTTEQSGSIFSDFLFNVFNSPDMNDEFSSDNPTTTNRITINSTYEKDLNENNAIHHEYSNDNFNNTFVPINEKIDPISNAVEYDDNKTSEIYNHFAYNSHRPQFTSSGPSQENSYFDYDDDRFPENETLAIDYYNDNSETPPQNYKNPNQHEYISYHDEETDYQPQKNLTAPKNKNLTQEYSTVMFTNEDMKPINFSIFERANERPRNQTQYYNNENLIRNNTETQNVPIIALTQGLKEKLSMETVEKQQISTTTTTYRPEPTSKFRFPLLQNPYEEQVVSFQPLRDYSNKQFYVPSESSINIAPDKDTVSFVIGNQQSVSDGHFIGTAIRDNPYNDRSDIISSNSPILYSDEVKMKPIFGSEASLSIGLPSHVETIPGKVVDDSLDEITTSEPPMKAQIISEKVQKPENNNILTLNSKPINHQLPTDLTPPSEENYKPPRNNAYLRPPWDPRPGHFYNGHPEYARPPRPEQYKRPQEPLPNILPQFRPNAKTSHGHTDKIGNTHKFIRQPLMERPMNNRPIGFFEKLHPPPLPNAPIRPQQESIRRVYEHDSHVNEFHHLDDYPPRTNMKHSSHPLNQEVPIDFMRMPPKIPERLVPKLENGEEIKVSTLQMLQSKQNNSNNNKITLVSPQSSEKQNTILSSLHSEEKNKSDTPLYVVYPATSTASKHDYMKNEKNTIIIGKPVTEMNSLRENEPLLVLPKKPTSHLTNNVPTKSEFPYPLEKPNVTSIIYGVDSNSFNKNTNPTESSNTEYLYSTKSKYTSWPYAYSDSESRIKIPEANVYHDPELISATLKSVVYTPAMKQDSEQHIAIAYTPTESPILNSSPYFSLPNENRIKVENNRIASSQNDKVITVSAIMHTQPKGDQIYDSNVNPRPQNHYHKPEANIQNQVPVQDFQAPFYASANVDTPLTGWSVIRDNPEPLTDRKDEASNTEIENLNNNKKEFDIEHFKPQLFGGFKPIIRIPEEETATIGTDRQE